MSKSQGATLDTGCISTYWFSNLGFRDQSRVSRWREGADVELRSSTRMKTLKTRTVNPPQTAGFITSSFMLTESSSNISSVKCPEVKTLTFVRPHTDRMNFLSEAESEWVCECVLNNVYTHWSSEHVNVATRRDAAGLFPERTDAQRGGSGTNPNRKPATRTADELHREHSGIWSWSGPDWVRGKLLESASGAKRLRVKTHKKRSHPKISSSWIYCCELLIYSKTSTVYDSRGM